MATRYPPMTRDGPVPGSGREVEIALMQQNIDALNKHIEATDARIVALEKERDKALIWGISALGSAVLGLVVWVANYVVGHLKP